MRNVMDDKQSGYEEDADAVHPKTAALAVAAFLLLVITKTANASIVPAALAPEALTPDSCSVQLKTVQFSGTFNLKSPHAPGTQALRFVIGTPENDKSGMAVAQIWSGTRCQASCSSVDMEKGDLSMPISLDLQCHGEALGPLSAHVAVLWDHGADHSTLVRFGSWLEGYEQASMKVEVDHFNTLSVASVSMGH
jgi:hypothetical protein